MTPALGSRSPSCTAAGGPRLAGMCSFCWLGAGERRWQLLLGAGSSRSTLMPAPQRLHLPPSSFSSSTAGWGEILTAAGPKQLYEPSWEKPQIHATLSGWILTVVPRGWWDGTPAGLRTGLPAPPWHLAPSSQGLWLQSIPLRGEEGKVPFLCLLPCHRGQDSSRRQLASLEVCH